MNSYTIQKDVVRRCMKRGNKLAVQNIYYWLWECDVMAVTKSYYTYEYEVKISRSDFVADFKKDKKHYDTSNGRGANYFYFVAPQGLIKKDEIPEYAGLLEVVRGSYMKVAVRAPMLHSEKLNDRFWKKLAMKLFWKTI